MGGHDVQPQLWPAPRQHTLWQCRALAGAQCEHETADGKYAPHYCVGYGYGYGDGYAASGGVPQVASRQTTLMINSSCTMKRITYSNRLPYARIIRRLDEHMVFSCPKQHYCPNVVFKLHLI